MRYYLFFFLVFCGTIHSQSVIKGIVSDDLSNVIPGVSVSVLDPNTKGVLAYTSSNANGEFSLLYKGENTSVILRAFLMNYGTLERQINLPSDDLLLELVPQETVLEEIFIKAAVITQSNDTLVYDLNSFASENDRVLEDVLKKMPGMEVLSSGEIKYQGKAINKFYVEGKDLMQGGYGAITKALPNLHVSKLQVLENHQPIKMLQGKIASSDAAINIVLKNKISFSGSGKVGVGGDPLLYNVSLSPMFFSKGLQYLVSYDGNNSGDEPYNKFRTFGVFSEFDVFTYAKSTGNTLAMALIGNPNIARSRYLFNKTNLVSGNFLTTLSKDWELNTNVYYLNDEISQNANQNTQIYLIDPNGQQKPQITYNRQDDNRFFAQELQAKFTLTNNAKDNYLKNILSLNVKRNYSRGVLLQNSDPISQGVLSPSFNLQNSFSTLVPLGSKKMGNFKSLINYTRDKQNYQVTPNGYVQFPSEDLSNYQQIKQMYLDNSFYTKNGLSVSWTFNKWTLTQEYNLLYTHRDLDSNLFGYNTEFVNLGSSYSNDLKYQQVSNTLSSRLYYKGAKWDFNFSLPLSYNSLVLKDEFLTSKDQLNRLDFLPAASVSYKVSGMLTLRGSARFFSAYTPLNELYPNYIFSGLNFSAYQSKIQHATGFSPTLRFEFKNPFNGLFANASFSSSRQNNKILFSREIDENGQQIIKGVEKDNQSNSKTLVASLGKFFSDFSTNVKLGYSLNTKANQVLVNTELLDVRTQGENYSLDISNNYLNWLNFSYNLTYSQNNSQTKNQRKTISYGSGHLFTLDIIPLKSHSLTYKLDYSQSDFNAQHFSSRFMDLMYRFKWDKKKIDIDLAWQNILNQKQYSQVIINEIQSSQTTYKIRPMQFLVSVRFTF